LKAAPPLVLPDDNETNPITDMMEVPGGGYLPYHPLELPEYEGIDLLPLIWKIPESEIDVHAVAIASTFPAPDLDHYWIDDNNIDEDRVEEAKNSRRALNKALKPNRVKDQRTLDLTNIVLKHQSSTESDPNLSNERNLAGIRDDRVIPGLGWALDINLGKEATGYCDGSPMSTCTRSPYNDCLLWGHNDAKTTLKGDALSGWLVVMIPKVKNGLIAMKIDWETPRAKRFKFYRTHEWTEVNGGAVWLSDTKQEGGRKLTNKLPLSASRASTIHRRTFPDDGQWSRTSDYDYLNFENRHDKRRKLGSGRTPPTPWPEDFELDISVNGTISKTFSRDELMKYTSEMAHAEVFIPLINDENLVSGDASVPIELGIRIRSELSPKDAAFSLSHIYYA